MPTYTHVYEPSDSNKDVSVSVSGGNVVEIKADGTIGPGTAGSTTVVGWVPYDVAAGGRAPVYKNKVVKMVASGAIAAGSRLIPAANGAVAQAGAAPDARTVIGQNFGPARVDGEVFEAIVY